MKHQDKFMWDWRDKHDEAKNLSRRKRRDYYRKLKQGEEEFVSLYQEFKNCEDKESSLLIVDLLLTNYIIEKYELGLYLKEFKYECIQSQKSPSPFRINMSLIYKNLFLGACKNHPQVKKLVNKIENAD